MKMWLVILIAGLFVACEKPATDTKYSDTYWYTKESQGIPKRIRVKDPRTGKPGTLDYPVKAIESGVRGRKPT